MRALILSASALAVLVTGSAAMADRSFDFDRGFGRPDFDSDGPRSFRRIATLPNYRNIGDETVATVSEIVAATNNGNLLVYTDAVAGSIGIVSIHFPAFPVPLGTVALGGDPTSVDILGNSYALVGVSTSAAFSEPSGHLAVVNINTRAIEAQLELGGQPDSVKISPDGRYVAVIIENERDEEVEVDGVEGGLPQAPAGFLAIVDIDAPNPAAWTVRSVDLSGLSAYAPDDPEPEFVDINGGNEAVVSLQENNHIALVDLVDGNVIGDFAAGSVDLDQIDAAEDGLITPNTSLTGIAREPDAVTWISTDGEDLIGTANEGDLFGGSRGFSIFDRQGALRYDSGSALEHIAIRHGHYPESRSENKGTEPEAIEFARFRSGEQYLFVGSERGSFVAVYDLDAEGAPEFSQLLPAPLGPEGVLAIPRRDLLVVSGEEDDPPFGVRSTMMIYALSRRGATYPQILSDDGDDGLPIAWSALSGLTSIPDSRDRLLAVWDSYYDPGHILTIDASSKPARVVDSIPIQGGSGTLDAEGIAIAPDGTYWIASEGNASGSLPNRLLQVTPSGVVLAEVELPPEIEACRAASENPATLGSGFEGVAVLGYGRWWWRGYKLLVAQQRGWDYTTPECEDLDDDGMGLNSNGEPNATRIWVYDPGSESWEHVAWELAPLPQNASWVGLSEISAGPWGSFVLIERDNRTGDWAELKTLVKVSTRDGLDGVIDSSEKAVYDMLPELLSTRGWISDKPEGTAITDAGDVYVVTDNDGVEDWSGETTFLDLGNFWKLFKRW